MSGRYAGHGSVSVLADADVGYCNGFGGSFAREHNCRVAPQLNASARLRSRDPRSRLFEIMRYVPTVGFR
jgi:hypothetical protein